MRKFCAWQYKQGSTKIYTCMGKLFAKQVGNCPYKDVKTARQNCSELLECDYIKECNINISIKDIKKYDYK